MNEENSNNDFEKVNNEHEQVMTSRNGKEKFEKRRPSVILFILIFLLGVCISALVFILVYEFKFKNTTVEEPQEVIEVVEEVEKDEPKVTIPEVDLDINGEFVQELYNKKRPFGSLLREYTYLDKKITKSEIPDESKMLFVLENYRNSNDYKEVSVDDNLLNKFTSGKYMGTSGDVISIAIKITSDELRERYKSIFGSDTDIIRTNIETKLGFVYEYVSEDDCFYGHSYAGGGGGGVMVDTRLSNVEKNEDGTEIYILDKFIGAGFSSSNNDNVYYEIYSVYGYSNGIGKIGELRIQSISEIGRYDYDLGKFVINNSIFEEYQDKLVTFKHTFKLDTNGNYYWYSTEPVNN